MLETGNFVDIRNGDVARNAEPIGIYWLQAPGAAIVRAPGIAEANPIWPYRIPSLLGRLVAVLATFSIGRRIAGVQAGVIADTMLGCSGLLTLETRIAKTDAALLAVSTVAMAMLARACLGQAIGRRGAALFWLTLGAGILIEGPITPMVAGLTALALIIADRRPRWLGVLRPPWGAPLTLLVVLPWFAAIGLAMHGQFFRDAMPRPLETIEGVDYSNGRRVALMLYGQ
jgi:hypothetical protein